MATSEKLHVISEHRPSKPPEADSGTDLQDLDAAMERAHRLHAKLAADLFGALVVAQFGKHHALSAAATDSLVTFRERIDRALTPFTLDFG